MDSKFVKWEIKLFLTYKKTIERSYNRIHVSYICADIRVLNKIGIDVDWKFTNRVQTKISTAMSIACFVNSSIRVALPIAKCTNHDDNLVRPPFYNTPRVDTFLWPMYILYILFMRSIVSTLFVFYTTLKPVLNRIFDIFITFPFFPSLFLTAIPQI